MADGIASYVCTSKILHTKLIDIFCIDRSGMKMKKMMMTKNENAYKRWKYTIQQHKQVNFI